jgi:hypothetical protein
VPDNLIALAILIAALAPGWAYLQAYRRHAMRDARSTTAEVVEMGAVGALATAAAALLVLIVAPGVPGLVTLHTLLGGTAAVSHAAWPAIVSAAVALLLSLVLCVAVGEITGRRAPHRVGTVHEGTLFVRALTERSSQGRRPYLTVELTDGRVVEGRLLHVSVNEDPVRRDLVLYRPIAWSGKGYEQRTASTAEKVLITGSLVKVVHLTYPAP